MDMGTKPDAIMRRITLIVAVAMGVLLGGSQAGAKMCADERDKINNWPDKQHDFPYCNYELARICVIGAADKNYDKPIPNWNRDFPLSDLIGDHCPEDYHNYAYAYIAGQLGYCGATCPKSVLDIFPNQQFVVAAKYGGSRVKDLSALPDTWIPYSRSDHIDSVGSHLAVLAEGATDDGNMEGTSAQGQEQALRDMYRSANYFTLADRSKFVNQACEVKNEAELREAIQWAFGFDRQFSFKQFDTDLIFGLFYNANNYTTENLGKAQANWAFDHMCTTGARQVGTSPTSDVTRYLLLPKICDDSGKVLTTGQGGAFQFPVMWRRVLTAEYLSSYGPSNKYQGCLLAGNDALDVKAVSFEDVMSFDDKGKPAAKIGYVWIPDYKGCWGDDCIIEKTIRLMSDIAVSQPVTMGERAPYITHQYELTVIGKNTGGDYKITTAPGFKPVDAGDQNGLFNMVEQIDRLMVSDVGFDSDLAALVSGPGSTSVQNSTIHSKVPITVRDGSHIVNNVFKPNGQGPFLKVADGAQFFTIQKNIFGSVGDALPDIAIAFGKSNSGSTFDNIMDGYVLGDKLSYVNNSPIQPPKADSSHTAVYHPYASGDCKGKIDMGGIGCYSIPISLKTGIYAVEVFAIQTIADGSKKVIPLGLFCATYDNRCSGRLDVKPKAGGDATIWMEEYVPTAGGNLSSLWELGIQPSGQIKPLQLRMIAHGIPANADYATGAPSTLSDIIEANLIQAAVSADDLKKAQEKYIQWITGPVSKWAWACVDNKTCGKDDKDCKTSCGWVNACAELQKDIERLNKKENPNAGYPMDSWVLWDSQTKGLVSKVIADANGTDKQPKPVTEFCKKYATGDLKKFLWKEFGGTLDYEPEDPLALACYWDPVTQKQTGQLWVGGKCESTNRSKCIWDANAKKMTGKLWKGDNGNEGECVDSEEASQCLKTKGKVWLDGKCQDEKAVCEAKGKVFSDAGKCLCPKGTTAAKDGSCVQPPPASPCKNPNDVFKDGICVPATTGGSTPGGSSFTSGGTGDGSPTGQGAVVSGQGATTPAPDKKPLAAVGGEAVQQAAETKGSATDSGSKWKKFWGCSLVR